MQIAPSILNADLADLAAEVARVPSADVLHFDVMDNHFVPNLTLGLPVVESLMKHTDKPMDIHLMIEDADTWAPQYAELGCESVTFHAEAAKAPIRLARELRRLGSRAAMALKPTTPIEPYADIITEFDMILLMSVNPGFGGQKFIPGTLNKLREARALIDASGREIRLEIDGGVNVGNIREIAEAGADTFVAGSAIFNTPNYEEVIQKMRAELALARP